MTTNRYFPQGIALDQTFCNRQQERTQLKTHIDAHEHVVLVAPRRYGKTSLIAQVLKENKLCGTSIDFFFVLEQADVRKQIINGITKIMSMLLPKTKAKYEKIIHAIKQANPKLSINVLGQTLEINSQDSSDKSIAELLLALDQCACDVNKSCVLVFDEFQQVGELKDSHAIEAVIRHAVERSRRVSYIFCGSKRHLLHEMFSDKSRPLYHLCDLMTIDRIATPCYQHFLNRMAKHRWQLNVDDDVANEIITLTANHPYYFNALCRRLWRENTPPTLANARNTWHNYVIQQSPWIETDLTGLSLNRRKVLTALAFMPTKTPQGQAFSSRTGLNPSGIKKALDDLLKLDLIHLDQNKLYQVLDPAMAYFIKRHRL